MITTEDRKELKKILGNNYAPGVIQILNDKEQKNSRGREYSANSIRQVFNGREENLDIELAIYERRDQIIIKKKELEEKRANKPV